MTENMHIILHCKEYQIIFLQTKSNFIHVFLTKNTCHQLLQKKHVLKNLLSLKNNTKTFPRLLISLAILFSI